MSHRALILTGYLLVFLLLPACKSSVPEKKPEIPEPLVDLSENDTFRSAKETGKAVYDFNDDFTTAQEVELSSLLIDYHNKTTRQIVVVNVTELAPYEDIRRFGTDLGNYWGIGDREKDNGLLIVLCTPLQEVGISTGRGTDNILTDSICKAVIEHTMIPEFKSGNYYQGIVAGTRELISKWK